MMKSLLVIFALAVFSFINVTNGQCTTTKGDACKTKYTDAKKTTNEQTCTAAYAYGQCLLDEKCNNDNDQKMAFEKALESGLNCSGCIVLTGAGCFTDYCSNKTGIKTCLDKNSCYVGGFKTAYDNYDSACGNGCNTVTVSVLMMFLSTLLMFIKN